MDLDQAESLSLTKVEERTVRVPKIVNTVGSPRVRQSRNLSGSFSYL